MNYLQEYRPIYTLFASLQENVIKHIYDQLHCLHSLDKKVDIAKYKNVLIWSNTFDAFFGYAGLYAKELPSETPKATEVPKTTEATKKQ